MFDLHHPVPLNLVGPNTLHFKQMLQLVLMYSKAQNLQYRAWNLIYVQAGKLGPFPVEIMYKASRIRQGYVTNQSPVSLRKTEILLTA